MVGHIHIMIIELLMKLDVILKNVGCTVTKMLDQNNIEKSLRSNVTEAEKGNQRKGKKYSSKR